MSELKKRDVIGAIASVPLALIAVGPAVAADLGGDGGFKDGGFVDPVPAEAQFYGVLRGGVTFPDDTDFQVLGLGVENGYDDAGYFVSGALGTSLTGVLGVAGFRGELEIGGIGNDIDSHNVQGLGQFTDVNAFGETNAIFGLASIYYDFATGTGFTPFIGAGGGFANVEFDGHGVTPTGIVLDDEDTGYAYHVTAGLGINVAHNLDLEVGYRYLGITELSLSSVDGTENDVDVNNNIVFVGARLKF